MSVARCGPPTMFRRTLSGVPSPFPHHNRRPRHEERQQEEDYSVAEGVAHAVVEGLFVIMLKPMFV